VRPDAAAELVTAYLRVNNYFVLNDLEFHLWEDGGYRAVTDVDIVAVRHRTPVGPVHYRNTSGIVECLLGGEVDPVLGVATDRCDVIIGEVKRGEASFNPALRDPRVLHGVFTRIGDVFESSLDEVIDELGATGRAVAPRAQARLVAFGHGGSVVNGMAMPHAHMLEWLAAAMARHQELFEISVLSDPVLSILALMSRMGYPLQRTRRQPPTQTGRIEE